MIAPVWPSISSISSTRGTQTRTILINPPCLWSGISDWKLYSSPFFNFFSWQWTGDKETYKLRSKAWAVTDDRIRHRQQVTSSGYWISRSRQQQGQKQGSRVKHPDIGTIVMSRGHKDGAGVRRSSGWLLIFSIAVSTALEFFFGQTKVMKHQNQSTKSSNKKKVVLSKFNCSWFYFDIRCFCLSSENL